MAEPTTAITDFLLAAVAFVLAFKSLGAWRFAFLFTGIAALAGGVYHTAPSVAVWKVTVMSVGVATFFLIAAAARATLSARAASIVIGVAGIQFLLYAAWMATHDEFIYVIADYGTGLLCAAVLYVTAFRHITRAAKFVLASIAVSVVGAAVQASGFTLHPRFNHNDLYHVIQIFALILLYRGGRAAPISRSTSVASL